MIVSREEIAGARRAEPDELVHIATAAADLCDKIAANRAERILLLERELMTNPHIPARREAEAEYMKLTEGRGEG